MTTAPDTSWVRTAQLSPATPTKKEAMMVSEYWFIPVVVWFAAATDKQNTHLIKEDRPQNHAVKHPERERSNHAVRLTLSSFPGARGRRQRPLLCPTLHSIVCVPSAY